MESYLFLLIPAVFCLIYAGKGWRMGAVTMIVQIASFFLSYWIVKYIVNHLQAIIIGLPTVGQKLEEQASTLTSTLGSAGLSGDVFSGLAGDTVYTIFGVILFAVLFVIVSWLIQLLIRKTRLINYIPLVGTVNRILGLILGILLAAYGAALIYHLLFWLFANVGLTDLAGIIAGTFWYGLF